MLLLDKDACRTNVSETSMRPVGGLSIVGTLVGSLVGRFERRDNLGDWDDNEESRTFSFLHFIKSTRSWIFVVPSKKENVDARLDQFPFHGPVVAVGVVHTAATATEEDTKGLSCCCVADNDLGNCCPSRPRMLSSSSSSFLGFLPSEEP